MTPASIADNESREQLYRILGHREFQATDRLRDFLEYVVQETLAGRASRLKGYTIATEVFGRPKHFDAAVDPIVRIEAGRLRRALERYYLVTGERDPIRIDIPKGRYVPRFTRQPPDLARTSDRPAEAPASPLPDGPSLMIVPFHLLPEDHELSVFANGLVDELRTRVHHYHEVISVPCAEDAAPPEGLGGGGHARFVLGGAIRRDASTLKITGHLVDAKAGQQIWSDSYTVDADAMAVIATQETVARDVLLASAGTYGAIALQLYPESREKPPTALQTYDAMLLYHHFALVLTPEAAEAAVAALQHTTQQDPEYGPAWSALANLYGHAYANDDPDVDAPLEVATEYARRGAALAPDDPLARTVMAFVHLLCDDGEEFLEEAETALTLHPDSPYYSGSVGFLLVHFGEFDRGRNLLEQAIARSAVHPLWFHHGLYICHFHRADYHAALMEARKIGFQMGFWEAAMRAAALAKLGRLEEATAAATEVYQQKPDFDRRIREILPRVLKPADLRVAFLDGLRQAGLVAD